MSTLAVTRTAWQTGAEGPEGLRPCTVSPAPGDLPHSDQQQQHSHPKSQREKGAAVRSYSPQDVTARALTPAALLVFPARAAPPPARAAPARHHALRMLRLLSAPPHVKRMRAHALAAGNCSLATDIPTNLVDALPKAKAEAGRPKLENPRGRARRRDSGLRNSASSKTQLRRRGRARPRCRDR